MKRRRLEDRGRLLRHEFLRGPNLHVPRARSRSHPRETDESNEQRGDPLPERSISKGMGPERSRGGRHDERKRKHWEPGNERQAIRIHHVREHPIRIDRAKIYNRQREPGAISRCRPNSCF